MEHGGLFSSLQSTIHIWVPRFVELSNADLLDPGVVRQLDLFQNQVRARVVRLLTVVEEEVETDI